MKRNKSVKIVQAILIPVVIAFLVILITPIGDKLTELLFPPPSPTPPDTEILSVTDSKNNPVSEGGATPATPITIEFNGTDNEKVIGFECSLDGDTFYNCETPYTPKSLEIGRHTFQVRSVDDAGDKDSTPAKYSLTVLTSAYIQGIVEKMEQPYQNVRVMVDEGRFMAKMGSGGEFLITNVPEGEHMLLVETHNNEPLYSRPFIIRNIDNGQVIDLKTISVSDAMPITTSSVVPTATTINTLFHPEEKQSNHSVALTHYAEVLKKPNVFKDGVWSNGTWSVRVWVDATPQILSNIERVTYYLHPTFSPSIVTRYTPEDNFDISLRAWGQFEIKAKAYFKDGSIVDLSRKLGFPL